MRRRRQASFICDYTQGLSAWVKYWQPANWLPILHRLYFGTVVEDRGPVNGNEALLPGDGMPREHMSASPYEQVHDLIPKLKVTEHFIDDALVVAIENIFRLYPRSHELQADVG